MMQFGVKKFNLLILFNRFGRMGNCSAIASKTLNASLEAIHLKDHARGSKTLAAWSLMKLIVVRRRRTSTLAASCIYLSVSCH